METGFRDVRRCWAGSEAGRQLGIHPDMSLDAFRAGIPVGDYASHQPWFSDLRTGKRRLLFPGACSRWAVSSGTTGSGKLLPISEGRLAADRAFHRAVAWTALTSAGPAVLKSRSHLVLPGTIEPDPELDGHWSGEISGHLASRAGWPAQMLMWRSPGELARMHWQEKMDAALSFAAREQVTVLAGAPVWVHRLAGALKYPEAVRLVVTGGAALQPYLPALRAILPPATVFLENYGASECFFAAGIQTGTDALPLIPGPWLLELARPGEEGTVLPGDAEPGAFYNPVVTTVSGLLRYRMDDLISVEHRTGGRPAVRIHGRSALVSDLCGEALYQHEIEAFMNARGAGIWYLTAGFTGSKAGYTLFADADSELASALDAYLQTVNRHFAIRRETGVLEPIGFCRVEAALLEQLDSRQHLRMQAKTVRLLAPSRCASRADLTDISSALARLQTV